MLNITLPSKNYRQLASALSFALLLSPSRLCATNTVEVVAKAGDVAPELEPGVSFSLFRGSSDLEAPRIADDGTIFSEFRLIGTTGAKDGGYALFPKTGPTRIAVREGDVLPGLPGVTLVEPPTEIAHAADGSFVWGGSLRGAGIFSSNDQAMFRFDGTAYQIMAREGGTIQRQVGQNTSFLTLTSMQKPMAGAGGVWGFVQDGAIYRREGDSMRRLMASGDSAGVDLTWRGLFDDVRMAADGSVLSQMNVQLSGVTTNHLAYGLAATSGAETSLLLRETTNAPGSPTRVLGSNYLRSFAVTDSGRFAAVMLLQPPETGFPTPALFVGGPGQATERALQFGTPVPGTAAGSVNNIFTVDAAGPWIVAWVGVANDPNVGSAVLMRRFDNPTWSTVITNNQPASDRANLAVGAFSRLAVAADGTVALGASVGSLVVGSPGSTAGLFLYRGGKLTLPVYLGLTLESGDIVTNRFDLFRRNGTIAGQYGEGRFLNSTGQAVVRVQTARTGVVGLKETLLRITPSPLQKPELPYIMSRQGNSLTLEVNGRVGFQYSFQQSVDLTEWTLMEPPVAGTDVAIQFQTSIQSSPSKRFFRVTETAAN
jgi:hypothetical protein